MTASVPLRMDCIVAGGHSNCCDGDGGHLMCCDDTGGHPKCREEVGGHSYCRDGELADVRYAVMKLVDIHVLL